ncbi:hypothetical protein [Massilia soli]|uniref:Uncharacterized protein n=1 Tax=Massilia soli TaxID=2792854 RepID=A0ABS7SRL9_9BURK|nr:hypothetical protein [Massilia soli]MBZ2208576.1 hypothetical protein [Massilia soli]
MTDRVTIGEFPERKTCYCFLVLSKGKMLGDGGRVAKDSFQSFMLFHNAKVELAMGFLEALFSGARAILQGVVEVAALAVRAVLAEIDHSAVGRVAIEFVGGVTKKYFSNARNLADEERELAERFRRDGRRSELDSERLNEIHLERERVKKALNDAATRQAEAELKNASDELISARLTDDDVSASSGILASKTCPECGGGMRIRQGAYTGKSRSFWWQCTAQNAFICPNIKINLAAEQSTVLRRPDADLDGSSEYRRKVWEQPNVVAKTHGRLRASLGDDDEQIICPHHVLPMKLMAKNRATGLMLDSYEYVCLGVTSDGRACGHKVEVKTFTQVSALLRRRDGVGIIDS